MQYLCSTNELTLTIKPGESAHWWVDSSYAPQHAQSQWRNYDARKRVAYSRSCKQKINTKRSTEAELVAIDNAMGQVLWTRHFLAAQGIQQYTRTVRVQYYSQKRYYLK